MGVYRTQSEGAEWARLDHALPDGEYFVTKDTYIIMGYQPPFAQLPLGDDLSFSAERLNPREGGLGFFSGWVVICRESGQPDRQVGPVYQRDADAEAEAQRLRRMAAKDP